MLNFFHTYSPDSVVFSAGFFSVYWYGFFISVAILAGYLITHFLTKDDLEFSKRAKDIYANVLIFGLIGARVFYVILDWGFYSENLLMIPAFYKGGLSIHGALIGGAISIFYFCKKRRISFWRLADVFAPSLALGQAIGRWGNYFNQELFGGPTEKPWGIFIEESNRPIEHIGSEFFHPTFLYESVWNFLIFIFLMFLFLRHRRRGFESIEENQKLDKSGFLFLAYLVLYSVGRAGTEFFRVDPMMEIFGIRLALFGSVVLVIFGLLAIFYKIKKQG